MKKTTYLLAAMLAGCGYCSKGETPAAPSGGLEEIAGASIVQKEQVQTVDASYAAQDFGRPDAGIKCGEGEFLDYWDGTAVCLAELEGSSFCGEYCGGSGEVRTQKQEYDKIVKAANKAYLHYKMFPSEETARKCSESNAKIIQYYGGSLPDLASKHLKYIEECAAKASREYSDSHDFTFVIEGRSKKNNEVKPK